MNFTSSEVILECQKDIFNIIDLYQLLTEYTSLTED